MRSQQVRNQYVLPYLNARGADITHILNHINGGWESWLQVGLGLAIAQNINGNFSREQSYYPGSGDIYDLCVTPQRGTSIYFEIKTQVNTADHTTTSRFIDDIEKIGSLNNQFMMQNVLITFSFSGLSNAAELANFNGLMLNANYAVTAFDMQANLLNHLTANTPHIVLVFDLIQTDVPNHVASRRRPVSSTRPSPAVPASCATLAR